MLHCCHRRLPPLLLIWRPDYIFIWTLYQTHFSNYMRCSLHVSLHKDPFDNFQKSALSSSLAVSIDGKGNEWVVAVKVYMEPGLLGGSTGNCRLLRCVAADDPKTPISVVGEPATSDVWGVASRVPCLAVPPLRRISSAAGLRRLWVDLLVPVVVVEPIQLPSLNCCTGRYSGCAARPA